LHSIVEESKEEQAISSALNITNKMTTSKKMALQKLIDIPASVI